MIEEPRCPICGFTWDHWMVCEYPGCHDGRLIKPGSLSMYQNDLLKQIGRNISVPTETVVVVKEKKPSFILNCLMAMLLMITMMLMLVFFGFGDHFPN